MKDVQLSNLQLVSDRFKAINYEVDINNVSGQNLKPYLKIDVSKQFEFDKKQKHHKAILELAINFQLKRGKKALLKFNTIIEGEFWGNANLPEKQFKELLIKAGLINLLTIARSKIIAMSSLFGFSTPIYIPFINLKEIIEKELKSLDSE